jgi:hypothetical protein
MHTQMNLELRRTTAATPCPEDVEKQERLHKRNLLRLTYLLRVEMVTLDRIIGSDESGCALMPVSPWRWELKGSRDAFSPTKEDKRQFTFDIVHNAEGKVCLGLFVVCCTACVFTCPTCTDLIVAQIVKIHVIFKGKSMRSLPMKGDMDRLRTRYPKFKFAVSPNHW